jgi:pimeloyl-ACP methyl ester carboxylesterase
MSQTSDGSVVVRERPVVNGVPARVFVGGDGPAVLLVHGGWGGAEFHWSRVWGLLAQRHRVIAPELPGLGDDSAPFASVREYALLDSLSIDRAACVGNSFGASVCYALAARWPARCSRLVMVDGIPMPVTPRRMARVGRTRMGLAMMRFLLRRSVYTRAAVARSFADPSRVPSELSAIAERDWPRIVSAYASILVSGDDSPPPSAPPALIWGAQDHLPGTSLAAGRQWQVTLGATELRAIEGAGHFPQVEAPGAFVDALESLVG